MPEAQTPPFPLTWTQWDTYNSCPYWFRRQYLDKDVPRQESPALEKGTRIHGELERFLLGDTDDLPEEVHWTWTEPFEELRSRPRVLPEVRVENDVAYGKLDVLVEGAIPHVIDFKTGKCRKHDVKVRDQLRMYTWLLGRNAFAELWWVEHPYPGSIFEMEVEFTPTLDKVWRKRARLVHEGPHDPKPSWKCKYCPVRDCPYNENDT